MLDDYLIKLFAFFDNKHSPLFLSQALYSNSCYSGNKRNAFSEAISCKITYLKVVLGESSANEVRQAKLIVSVSLTYLGLGCFLLYPK